MENSAVLRFRGPASLQVCSHSESENIQIQDDIITQVICINNFILYDSSVSASSKWAAAVTQPAPAFKATAVHNGEFKEMSLSDFKGKYLVLFFYPLDLWVFVILSVLKWIIWLLVYDLWHTHLLTEPLSFLSTFVCPTEIISFSDKASEFHDVNCAVVGVSVDSHFTHLAWINTPRKVLFFLSILFHSIP